MCCLYSVQFNCPTTSCQAGLTEQALYAHKDSPAGAELSKTDKALLMDKKLEALII